MGRLAGPHLLRITNIGPSHTLAQNYFLYLLNISLLGAIVSFVSLNTDSGHEEGGDEELLSSPLPPTPTPQGRVPRGIGDYLKGGGGMKVVDAGGFKGRCRRRPRAPASHERGPLREKRLRGGEEERWV
jgi:hypothetical protein